MIALGKTVYSGQQQAIGALVVACVVMLSMPSVRRRGASLLVLLFVAGVVIDLVRPGTISGAHR